MKKLKPCPFCGREVKLDEVEFEDYAGNSFTNSCSVIGCAQCGISMAAYPKKGYGTTEKQKEGLIKRWNRRANETEKELDAAIKTIKEGGVSNA